MKKTEGWAAWHPVKGFDLIVNVMVQRDLDDAITDAKANTVLDGDDRWIAVRVKVVRI